MFLQKVILNGYEMICQLIVTGFGSPKLVKIKCQGHGIISSVFINFCMDRLSQWRAGTLDNYFATEMTKFQFSAL